MNEIDQIPYIEVEFDRDGKRIGQADVTLPAGATDLFVISHGWNNNRAEAQALYRNFFTSFKAVAPPSLLTGRGLVVLGVIWPSKKFDELVAVESTVAASGGGASLGTTVADPKGEQTLREKLDALDAFFTGDDQRKLLAEAKTLIPDLEKKSSARSAFVEKIRGLLTRDAADKEDASDIFFRCEPQELMDQLRIADEDIGTEVISGGGASFVGSGVASSDAGGAAGVAEFLQGFKSAATNIVNFTTYYEMKDRAGKVGKNGVAPLIDKLCEKVPRVHLLGHSFGGRVVTAAAAASTAKNIRSMVLLQAAFSHNGFSRSMEGAFRSVVDQQRIKGPILVTHTKNDKAVGIAYPLASRLAGQIAAALGDANDKYGGLGRNGVQKMNPGEATTGDLLEAGKFYAFVPGKFFNLEGSAFIANHGDVAGKEVAYAAAIASLGSS